MTITTQHLIDAAKAIGIKVKPIESTLGLYLSSNIDCDCHDICKHKWLTRWNPEHDKSQLMDLYYILNIDVNFFPEGGGYLNHKNIQGFMHFANNFESFAEAIILAAAEIGRVMK